MTESIKKGFIISCIVIFILGLLPNLWLMFYHVALKDSVAIQTAYVDSMAYSGDEEKFFVEAEYFPNVFGVKLNYYTDTEVPEKQEDGSYGKKYTYSTGVQFEGSVSYKVNNRLGFWKDYDKYILKNCTYYNSIDSGQTYIAITDFTDQSHWVYDVGGELVLIKEKGYENQGGNLGWKHYLYHGVSIFVKDLYSSIESLEDGVHIVTFDLSKYFTFTYFDESTGKFEEEIVDKKVLEKYMFVNIKVIKSSNDFVSANQSELFNMFKGDPNWTLYDFEKADYWRARNEYNFTIKDFTFVYENGGYYLKLLPSVQEFFSVFKNMKYVVTIDLDCIYYGSDTKKVDGFIRGAFGSLGIDEVYLTSKEKVTFKTYNQYSKIIRPANITIVVLGGAT